MSLEILLYPMKNLIRRWISLSGFVQALLAQFNIGIKEKGV